MQADADHDGRVNLNDFNILAANFGQSERTFSEGDFNYDGAVGLDDFNILAGRFGTTIAAPVAATPSQGAPLASGLDREDEQSDLGLS